MSKLLLGLFGPSWRTTLTGYATAAAVAATDYVQSSGNLSKLDPKALVVAVGIAVLGRFAKANNVSNSPTPLAVPQTIVTTPNGTPREPVALAEPVKVVAPEDQHTPHA